MEFDVKTVNELLDIDESYKAPERMLQLMLDDQKRVATFKKFLKISTNMEFDWFHEYFEDEQAERKTKKQDFTPQSISRLMTSLVGRNPTGTYYEPAAGTGGIVITRWWNDRLTDPVHLKPKFAKNTGFSILTYDPRNYWYQAEEMSDRAIPFLLFNMAIRGMNGAVVQCDSLEREAKEAYFVRNNTDNWLRFSEIIKLPHTPAIENMFGISKWVKEF